MRPLRGLIGETGRRAALSEPAGGLQVKRAQSAGRTIKPSEGWSGFARWTPRCSSLSRFARVPRRPHVRVASPHPLHCLTRCRPNANARRSERRGHHQHRLESRGLLVFYTRLRHGEDVCRYGYGYVWWCGLVGWWWGGGWVALERRRGAAGVALSTQKPVVVQDCSLPAATVIGGVKQKLWCWMTLTTDNRNRTTQQPAASFQLQLPAGGRGAGGKVGKQKRSAAVAKFAARCWPAAEPLCCGRRC